MITFPRFATAGNDCTIAQHAVLTDRPQVPASHLGDEAIINLLRGRWREWRDGIGWTEVSYDLSPEQRAELLPVAERRLEELRGLSHLDAPYRMANRFRNALGGA